MLHRLICLFLSALLGPLGQATERVPPLTKLVPNPALKPGEKTDCERLLSAALRPSREATKAAVARTYTNKELLGYVNYLSARRFNVTSLTLMRETMTIQALLNEKFGVALNGRDFSKLLSDSFGSVGAAVLKTPEGKKLDRERDDSDYKSWSLPVVIRVAKDCEKMGLPFERKFLMTNSSLVGMKLAEKYGYPVRGEPIVFRTEKLGLRIEDIRAQAGLPEVSPNSEKVATAGEIPWTREMITKIFTLLTNAGIEIIESTLLKQRKQAEEIIWQGTGYHITIGSLEGQIYALYGGWPEAKKSIGITYTSRARQDRNRPDWSKEFYIELLQFCHANGYQLSYTFLLDQTRNQALLKLIKEKYGRDISGKSIYERGSELFGSFEAALQTANVPYLDFRQSQLTTDFKEWSPEFSAEKLNAPMLIEILKFIESEGYEPTEHLLTTENKFESLRNSILEKFGFDVKGETVFKRSKSFFGSFSQALIVADVATPSRTVWSQEDVFDAVTVVLKKYPGIIYEDLRFNLSEEAGDIVSDELDIVTSGYTLTEQMTNYGGFPKVMRDLKSLELSNRAWPYAGSPTKEFFLEVISFISSLGYFPSNHLLTEPGIFDPVDKAIREHFGFPISRNSIEYNSKLLFDGMQNVRAALGLSYHPERDFPNENLLPALQFLLEKYPELSSTMLNQTHSAPIGALLTEKYGVKIAGVTFHKLIKEEYGSLPEAFEKLGARPSWTRAFPPTKADLDQMLRFIEANNFVVNRKFLIEEKTFAPAQKLIKKKFGKKISGLAIYQFSFKLYGENGLGKALEAAHVPSN